MLGEECYKKFKKKELNILTIHGLWPSYKSGLVPQWCNLDTDIQIDNFTKDMDNYWINNPLILRGPTGSGKTHFMRALENNLLEKNPSMKVCFISAEAFTNEFVDSIKNKTKKLKIGHILFVGKVGVS